MKKYVMTLGIIAILSLTSCAKESKFDWNTTPRTPDTTVTDVQSVKQTATEQTVTEQMATEQTANEQTVAEQIDNEQKSMYGTVEHDVITVDSSNIAQFKTYVKSIQTTYAYEDILDARKSLLKYEAIGPVEEIEHEHDLLKGSNTVDAQALFDSVKKNNKAYLKDYPSSLYEKMSDKEIKKICGIISGTMNQIIAENPNIDIEEISCNLGSLKIFNKNSTSTAFVSTDNCLGVSENMMNVLIKMNKDVDVFRNTMMHETVHIAQRACDDHEKVNFGKNIGVSYKWTDVTYNPLNFIWLFEAAAEKNVVNMTGDKPIVYQNMISYLESLSLSTLLIDQVQVYQTEKVDFSKDLESLFDQFQCETENEKVEWIHMMASVNIIQIEPYDFDIVYQNQYVKNLDEAEYSKVKCTLKASVMETLSKQFYLNLVDAIEKKDVTLQDIFYLITLFENDVNGHIKYTNPQYDGYNQYFVQWYTDVQDEFFKTIALGGSFTQDEIIEKFDAYSATLINSSNEAKENFSLTWLEKDKRDYFKTQFERLNIFGGESIRRNHQKTE